MCLILHKVVCIKNEAKCNNPVKFSMTISDLLEQLRTEIFHTADYSTWIKQIWRQIDFKVWLYWNLLVSRSWVFSKTESSIQVLKYFKANFKRKA